MPSPSLFLWIARNIVDVDCLQNLSMTFLSTEKGWLRSLEYTIDRVSPQMRTILYIPNPSPEIHKNSFHITWRGGGLPPRWRLPILCSASSQPGHCRNLRHRSGGSPSQWIALASKFQSNYYIKKCLWQYWRCTCWIKLSAFILSPRYENDPQRASTWLATQPRIIRFSLNI